MATGAGGPMEDMSASVRRTASQQSSARARLTIHVGPPLRGALDRHPTDDAATVVNRLAERYHEILRRSVPQLAEAEWLALADALNGVLLESHSIGLLWAEVEEADREGILSRKWGIDARDLSRRLRDLPYASLAAIAEIVERLWAEPEADFGEQLRAWGVVRE
jgi:hypothetical protein